MPTSRPVGGPRARRAARLVATALALVLAAGAVATIAPAPAGAVTLVAQGSVQQVFVTGATPGATVDLLDGSGAMVASATADTQGAVVFGNDPVGEMPLPPGPGYRARQGSDTSPAVTVLDPSEHPDQSFYDGRHLEIADAAVLPDREIGYQYLQTRDGTTLSVNVLPPLDPSLSPPYPVLVDYSGYWPSDPDPLSGDWDHKPMWVARAAGYAVVGVNIRGTTCSGGAFAYFEELQQLDGYDVVETVAAQPWAARVGMMGLSYPGISQLFVAATQPPHLAAISPLSTIADTYRSTLYPGGILDGGHSAQWAAERDAWAQPAAMDWVRDRIAAGDPECAANQVLHAQNVPVSPLLTADRYYEPSGDALAPRTFVGRIDVPTFLAQAWQDEQVGADTVTMLDDFTGLGGPGEPPLRVELLNGAHAEPYTPEVYLRLLEFLDLYVAHRVPTVDARMRRFAHLGFDDLMEAPGIDLPPSRDWPDDYDAALAQYEAEPPVRVNFEQGAAGTGDRPCPDQDASPAPCPPGYPYAAFSHQFESWPPPATQATRFYLQPDGALATTPAVVPDGSARGQDTYRYDGSTGGRTIGSSRGLMAPDPGWRWDQYPERDSLSFLTPAMTGDMVMAGTGSVDLWLRATAPDVDLEVDLTEVRPDGKETYVQSGWLRAAHRHLDPVASTELLPFPTHLAADAEALPAGEFVPARVAIYPFAHVFREGSRLRLTIKSPGGNRPSWNFDSLQYPDDRFVDVAHSVGRPSAVVLPVQPDVTVPVGLPACGALRAQPCREYRPSRAPTAVTTRVVDRQLSVAWSPPATTEAVTGYEVTVQPTGEVLTAPAAAATLTYPSPDPGTRYSFTVRATFAGGPGPWSTASQESPGPSGFADVPPTAWYAEAVDWTTAYGVLSGYPHRKFGPGRVATRAQVATALWNLAGRPAATGDGATYADVPVGARYQPALDWLDDAGIEPAPADGKFRPRDAINRARLAVWLHRTSGALTGSAPNTYADVADGAWFAAAADWWQAQGLAAPSTAASFKPAAPVRRGQLAGWLWNLARTPAAWAADHPW